MKSTTNQLYALCVLLFALFICAQVQIDTLKRNFNTAMFNLAEFEDRTITSAQYEYHINIDQTGYDIYNSQCEFIGRAPFGEGETLDNIFITDNE